MDDWHKALALTMRKLGVIEILITQDDMAAVEAIAKDDVDRVPAVVVFESQDGVHIRLTTNAEVNALNASLPQ